MGGGATTLHGTSTLATGFVNLSSSTLLPPLVASALAPQPSCPPLQGSTRLLVTHQRQYFPRCDRLAVLRGGRLVACGTWAEVAALQLAELDTGVGGRGGGRGLGKGGSPVQSGTIYSPAHPTPPGPLAPAAVTLSSAEGPALGDATIDELMEDPATAPEPAAAATAPEPAAAATAPEPAAAAAAAGSGSLTQGGAVEVFATAEEAMATAAGEVRSRSSAELEPEGEQPGGGGAA